MELQFVCVTENCRQFVTGEHQFRRAPKLATDVPQTDTPSRGGNSVVLDAAPVVVTLVILVSVAVEPDPEGAPVTLPDAPDCEPLDVVAVAGGGVRLGVASAGSRTSSTAYGESDQVRMVGRRRGKVRLRPADVPLPHPALEPNTHQLRALRRHA